MISSQDSGYDDNVEYAYQILIKNVSNNERMVDELQSIGGVKNLNLTVQEQLLQI